MDQQIDLENAETDAFIFRFNFEESADPVAVQGDPLIEMVRQFLTDIQRIGYLCINDKPVYIDGFVLNNQPKKIYPL